jgi:hypothetical protein
MVLRRLSPLLALLLAVHGMAGVTVGQAQVPPEMLVARFGPGAVVGPEGRIYAIGGSQGRCGGSTDTVEVYDLGMNTWSFLPPMAHPRGGLGAATANGLIYAVSDQGLTGTVEAYDQGFAAIV